MIPIHDVETFTPEPAGRMDLLLAGTPGRADGPRAFLPARARRESSPATVSPVPGLVDGHVHFAGGGGEGGSRAAPPSSRLATPFAEG